MAKLIETKFVPRHLKMFDGLIDSLDESNYHCDCYLDVLKPVYVKDSGESVQVTQISRVPVSKYYSKFKVADFNLSTLLAANVPLRLVDVQIVTSLQDVDNINRYLKVLQSNNDFINFNRNLNESQSDSIDNSQNV